MRAYLEAAKTNLVTLPERLKAWQIKRWEETKRKLNTTDWPQTIVHFIGWAVRQTVSGVLYGMGALSLLIHIVVWNFVIVGDFPDGPIPMPEIYGELQKWLLLNTVFAGAGVIACMAINLHKLRLHRLHGHEPMVFVIEPTNEEALALALKIVNRQGNPKIS